MTLLQIDDYKLHVNHYFADRKFPTLLLIHDLGQDASVWEELIESFRRVYNVITYDLFGHGKTTDSKARVTMNQLVREAATGIQRSEAEKVHLIGSGFGGLIAILTAKAFRQSIASVSLLSTPCFLPRGAYSSRYRYITRLLKIDRQFMIRTITAGSIYPSTEEKENYLKKAYARLREQTCLDFITLLNRLNQKHDFLFMDEISHLNIPVLNLIPEYEASFSSEAQAILSHVVPKCKHLSFRKRQTIWSLNDPMKSLS